MSAYLSAALLVGGSAFMFLAGLGLIRMPDLYTRLSATSKAATLGVALTLVAAALLLADVSAVSRAVLVIVFVFLTAPVAANRLGQAAYRYGVPLWDRSVQDDLAHRRGAVFTEERG